jgi:hypothetical protein
MNNVGTAVVPTLPAEAVLLDKIAKTSFIAIAAQLMAIALYVSHRYLESDKHKVSVIIYI